MTEPKRIAIIGSGISGLTCAWLLKDRYEVVLFEADSRLGGHTNTVDLERNGESHKGRNLGNTAISGRPGAARQGKKAGRARHDQKQPSHKGETYAASASCAMAGSCSAARNPRTSLRAARWLIEPNFRGAPLVPRSKRVMPFVNSSR